MAGDPVRPPVPKTSRRAPVSPDPSVRFGRPLQGWRLRLHTIIFEADTRAGRAFDLALIWVILASIVVVVLDSIVSVRAVIGDWLSGLEWVFTLLFSVEYIARLLCVRHPLRYALSVYGLIDLIALLPTYLAILVPGLHALIDVRVLRLLRIFRILKLGAYVAEFGALGRALAASRRKILVFLSFVMMVVLVMGTLMYVVEGAERLHQHSGGRLLGDHHDDHGGLRRHHTQDRPGTADRVGDDADRLGHAGRADRHRQRRIHRAEGATGDHHPRLP
jgi:hypothetical protein